MLGTGRVSSARPGSISNCSTISPATNFDFFTFEKRTLACVRVVWEFLVLTFVNLKAFLSLFFKFVKQTKLGVIPGELQLKFSSGPHTGDHKCNTHTRTHTIYTNPYF